MNLLTIFDLDGTLVDSVDQIGDAINETRLKHGFSQLSPAETLRLIGLPGESLIRDLDLDEKAKISMMDDFRVRLAESIQAENRLYPGVIPLLEKLSSRGAIIAVATSKPQQLAQAVVESSELRYFVSYVSGLDNCEPKPNPTVIRRITSEFPNRKAVMFGDRIEDILAARGAGIPSVGIAQTYHSKTTLESTGAMWVFNSISGLYEGVDELLRDLIFHAE